MLGHSACFKSNYHFPSPTHSQERNLELGFLNQKKTVV